MQVGDGRIAVALIFLAVIALILIGRMTSAKTKRLSPGEDAPWTGRYGMTLKAHANVDRGVQLPPPNPSRKDEKWRLENAHSGSGWLVVVLALAVVGALAYGQVDVSGLQRLGSNATGSASLAPPPPRQPAARQHLRQHGRHGVRTHRPND
ncbi:MAG TPA: hypothetical protein VGL20_08165 [Candidatus Dormibacteraeota bacterium]